ncbi:hypothetical protein AYM40_29200 [Paraburkholderia phytofirmans OLGA172]|uniref:Helix-turn-helix domain-containing protein n=1 Tax=Paraburkholderia phytofirmans OLGA172 TaxID=1417228 RepID=A0A160FTZ1_9BURK|nr:hypothetical protein [Paraburkholderia phytofirmans]ANB76326.1 hypothetical protein AYM40_29200 [Paraburkholderia phytofirmans OLGA172]
MTLPELAQRLNVSWTYVRKLVSQGDIRASAAPNGEPLFDDTEAEAYVSAAKKRQARAMEEYMEVSQKQRR